MIETSMIAKKVENTIKLLVVMLKNLGRAMIAQVVPTKDIPTVKAFNSDIGQHSPARFKKPV